MAGLPNPVRCKAKQVPMTRPAEGPGTPHREMVTLDRIRLTGLLPKSPAKVGLFHLLVALGKRPYGELSKPS